MSDCRFEIELKTDPEKFITACRSVIEKNGGEIYGNGNSGKIVISTPLGLIQAEYAVTANQLIIAVYKKPMLIGCKNIKEILMSHLPNK